MDTTGMYYALKNHNNDSYPSINNKIVIILARNIE